MPTSVDPLLVVDTAEESWRRVVGLRWAGALMGDAPCTAVHNIPLILCRLSNCMVQWHHVRPPLLSNSPYALCEACTPGVHLWQRVLSESDLYLSHHDFGRIESVGLETYRISMQACKPHSEGRVLTFCTTRESAASGPSAASWPSRMTSVRAAAYRLPSAHQNACDD